MNSQGCLRRFSAAYHRERALLAGRALCAAGLLCLMLLGAAAAAPADLPLLEPAREGAEKRISTGTPDEVSFARGEKGVTVTIKPGKAGYPGVEVKPEGAVWDLSAFGHVDARVANTGTEPMTLSLRVDNDGNWQDNPWSCEHIALSAGETGTVRVRFGTSWGKPGFALNPAKVIRLLLFIGKVKTEQSFRIESVVAGGSPGEKPPVKPDDVRTKPAGGILLGQGSAVDAATQLLSRGGRAEVVAGAGRQSLRVTLPAGAPDAAVLLKPAVGRWDLRDWLQVVVRVRNAGGAPLTPKARIEASGRAPTWVVAEKPLAPGAEGEVVLPFAGDIATLGDRKSGSQVESDRAGGISVAADGEGERVLEVESVRAVLPPPPALPEWLGKRPPVPGEWTQTLAEEFDGKTLDESKWTLYHPNYWDTRSHFSKENVLLGNGLLRLRFEKKRGHADDDPAKPETDWATGFITSKHKWAQRYGYFECRMKLPRAPGLWPAFWMMPDRGKGDPKGESTSDGGMEFDILEYLTRYGPYRYNIALHWDGYGKEHKAIGGEGFYVQPDKEGFVVAGLLWEPGRATFYANGAAVAKWENPRVASVPEYILFTAVSGGWGGNDLTGEGLPDDTVLDYVRAWQRKDLAVVGNQ